MRPCRAPFAVAGKAMGQVLPSVKLD